MAINTVSSNHRVEPARESRSGVPQISDTEAASAFSALGSEQRLAILQSLVRAGPEGLSMGALGERTDITGSTLTHHLKFLLAAGLVNQEKQGRSIVCTAVAYGMIEALSSFLLQHCCADARHQPASPEHRHV